MPPCLPAALARFRRLAADQQDTLSGRLRALPVEQRQDVLTEWSIRCAAGTVRDAAAYLFGLIRKALQGTFRLWAAHKNRQERPASGIQEAPRETPTPPRHPEHPWLNQRTHPLPGKWHRPIFST
jgi:hypothetical protein